MDGYNVNIEHYRVFFEVAQKKSFSAAANALFVSQPAVSQTITSLEKTLGVRLFIRSSKGVSLTKEGEHLIQYVEPALSMLKTGEVRIQEDLKLERGEVKIAAADTISSHYLSKFLQSYNNQYPNIKIKVINRTSRECIELIKTAAADIAFINLPIKKNKRLKITRCLEVHDIFVANSKFNDIKGKILSPAELVKFPLIMLEPKSNSRNYVDEYFIENGVKFEPEIELGSHDLLLEFSKIGLGISCVVKEFSMRYLESTELFELTIDPPITARSIGMAVSSTIPLSNAAEKFVKLINHK